jgi:hypothetical protein
MVVIFNDKGVEMLAVFADIDRPRGRERTSVGRIPTPEAVFSPRGTPEEKFREPEFYRDRETNSGGFLIFPGSRVILEEL